MRGTLVQLSVSPGGMPKLAVPSAQVTREGVAGDWQQNRKYHGGLDRAICIYSVELYDWLREEGIDLQWGSVGENFTTQGIELGELSAGSRLRVGKCVIEITKVRVPCRNLNNWDKRLMKLIQGRSGWMARVTKEGLVREGDEIEVCKN
jgi:MOSC domain-containing protein YiiM